MKPRMTAVVVVVLAFVSSSLLDVLGQAHTRPPHGARPHGTPAGPRAAGPHPRATGPAVSAPRPAWLRPGGAPHRPLHVAGPVRTVCVGGANIVVPEPTVVTLPRPVATAPESFVALPAPAKSPLVEFALIAEQRMKDLAAASNAAAQSQEGITELEGNKFCKAYTAAYVTGFDVQAGTGPGAEYLGRITSATRLMVQVGDTKEAVTATAGYPDENSKVQAATEMYVYQGGKWAYAAPKP